VTRVGRRTKEESEGREVDESGKGKVITKNET
jgi:hypothetical protein